MIDIKGYEGLYAIDKEGNIFSYPNKAHSKIKQLKPRLRKNGYTYVNLMKDKHIKDCTVHRLIASTYIGDVEGKEVNHINGIRNDNRIENLEIVSKQTNILHGIHVNKNGMAKFTHEEAENIKERVNMGDKQYMIAEELNVSRQVINHIVKGNTYSNSSIVLSYKGAA